ncbi:hypothetical protein R1flu_027526 [Riccia fluitans]|uniref:Caprin-1 dimerization domain-containing protein n=1 Tax=Riccia fluitans TaxID=41844 RepID=A0ABD1XN37_9MARC
MLELGRGFLELSKGGKRSVGIREGASGMAGLEGVQADEGYANTGGPKDGPVLTMMSKRLRALRKKFNRILQIEENKAQGKTINKEQQDVLKTKIAIAALIDEYEKLRQPLLTAVKEEVAEREKELMAASLQRQDEEESVGDEVERDQKAAAVVTSENEAVKDTAEENAELGAADSAEDVNGNDGADDHDVERGDSEIHTAAEDNAVDSSAPASLTDAEIEDLLKLLYFAQLFDVRSQGETPSFVWTKVHERSSCLSYDFVTDDATTPLVEGDLDALSIFGSLLTTRSPNVTVSHKEALEKCIEHAKSYLMSSDAAVGELGISYSRLRERLNRILSSEYFTMTPELQTVSQQTAAAAATAAGQYVTKAPALDPQTMSGVIAEEDDGDVRYYHQEAAVSAQYYQARGEYLPAVPMVIANGIPLATSPLVALTNTAPYVPESMGASADTPQFGSHEEASQATPLVQENTSEQEHAEPVNVQSSQGQQHQNHHQGHQQGAPRGGGYHNMRGRHGGYGGQGSRGGRGAFPNGRGGRPGRGPGGYQGGGRGGQFYDQGGYYPRNHYGGGGRGGRGGRGGGGNMMYSGHGNVPAQSGTPPPAVATGSS